MKKKSMGLGIRTWAFFLFTTAFLFSSLYTTRIYAEEVTPEDKQAYKEALEDTATATQAEIFRGLLAVVPGSDRINYERLHGDQIEWIDQEAPGNSPVKVVTFLSMESYNKNYKGKMSKAGTLTKSIWVTVVPEMKNFFVGQECPPKRERIRQVLGLNPAWEFDVLVELWVDSSDLFRPAPDPEITDHEGELSTKIKEGHWTFPSEINAFLTIDDGALFLDGWWANTRTFKEWFTEEADKSYSIYVDPDKPEEGEKPIVDWRSPWTRLGYTYDWGNRDNHVGLSEFLVRISPYDANLWVQYGKAIFHDTPEWDEYFRCGPKAPAMVLTTSATGVTIDWAKVTGADGYYLLYKQVERGTRFEPPFEENDKIDVGDTNTFTTTLASGDCFYVAVQSYSQEGRGGISNIEYFYIP